jgi:hypothetical protein
MDCGVCLESRNETFYTTLPCEHKVCNECFPKIRVPVCPFCRHKYGNTSDKHYNEIDEEFDFDFNIVYYSEDEYTFESERSRRRTRRRRRANPGRPRQVTNETPVNIFIIEPQEVPNVEPSYVNTKEKRIFKNNDKRRNKKNNSWNQRRLQVNLAVSQSY